MKTVYDLSDKNPNPGEPVDLDKWQRETDAALERERRFHYQHREEQASRAAQEKTFTHAELVERALREARTRGLSFEAPAVPGDGWASQQVARGLLVTASHVQELFVALVEAEEGVAAARRYLGGAVQSPIVVGATVEVGNLDAAKSRLELAEARFAVAYEAFNKRRAELSDPLFLERLEQCNAIAGEAFFAPFITEDAPELDNIARAIRFMLETIAIVQARHELALRKNQQGVLLARQLGIAELPDWTTFLGGHVGRGVVQRVAAKASRDWREATPEFRYLDLEDWLPDFRDPKA